MSEENVFKVKTGAIRTRNGAENYPVGDDFGSLITLSQGGPLQSACDAGRLFTVCNQAAVATSTTLNTAFTGLGVCNPIGSGYKMIFHEFGWGMSVIGTDDGVISLATTTSSGFSTSLVPRNRKFGGPASIAQALESATIVAPVIEQVCGTFGHPANTTVQISVTPQIVDLKGGLILLPGRAVVTDGTTATGTAVLFYFIWEEVLI